MTILLSNAPSNFTLAPLHSFMSSSHMLFMLLLLLLLLLLFLLLPYLLFLFRSVSLPMQRQVLKDRASHLFVATRSLHTTVPGTQWTLNDGG